MPKTTGGKDFQWTDDEAELLLSVTHDYKVKKSTECVDWESVKSKYEDILELMLEALPYSPDEAQGKDYPHEKAAITKSILTTKLKNIRIKFRQTVDSGRRSGHGRVVMLYYELCEKIWGGSPATNQIEGGVESTDLYLLESSEVTEPEPPVESTVSQPEEESSSSASSSVATTEHRRQLLDSKLKNYKQERLKRKLPVDAQLLSCAQEELAIKRRLMEQMEGMEKQYSENMSRLSANMEKLTDSISSGFSMLHMLIGQQPMYPYPPPPQPQSPFPLSYAASPHPPREPFPDPDKYTQDQQ